MHHRWEKNTTFKLGHPVFLQRHTMLHVPLMFLSERREFPSVPCLAGKKKLDDCSLLEVAEIALVP